MTSPESGDRTVGYCWHAGRKSVKRGPRNPNRRDDISGSRRPVVGVRFHACFEGQESEIGLPRRRIGEPEYVMWPPRPVPCVLRAHSALLGSRFPLRIATPPGVCSARSRREPQDRLSRFGEYLCRGQSRADAQEELTPCVQHSSRHIEEAKA